MKIVKVIFILILSASYKTLALRRSHAGTIYVPKAGRIFLKVGKSADSSIQNESIISRIEDLNVKKTTDLELNALIEKMPNNEKYSLLLQSYSNIILESKIKDKNILTKMESLFDEMVSESIEPDKKSCTKLFDAAAAFCSVETLGKTLRSLKAGGSIRAFGVANSQVTSPVVDAISAAMVTVDVPTDDREIEVLFASIAFAVSSGWVMLQAASYVNSEVHPWATLLSTFILGVCALDVTFRQAKGIRQAAAGLDRLILRDDERQADVSEAVRLLSDVPDSLAVYKQPAALRASSAWTDASTRNNDAESQSAFGLGNFLKGFAAASPSKPSAKTETKLPVVSALKEPPKLLDSERLFGIGRILIWLAAPVAAEYMKYGKTVLSDPRRSKKLITILSALKSKTADSSQQDGSSVSSIQLPDDFPLTDEDQSALLQWAFFESSAIIKQYGDLLEEVTAYMGSGTSTVASGVKTFYMLYGGVRVACFILLVQYSSNFMYGRRFALKSAYYGMGAMSASILSNGVTGNNKKFVLCQPLHSSALESAAPVEKVVLKPNPLLLKSSLPLFAEIKSEHILPAVSTDLNALKENFVDFEAVLLNPQKGEAWGQKRVEYDYETVVEKLEKIQFPLAYSWGVVGHLMGVQNSDDLRKAHDTIQPQVIEVYQKIGQSQALYTAMTALQKRNSVWKDLDEAQKRIVSSAIKQMQSSGVGLDPAQREKFNKLQLEAAELATKFSNNVLDSTKKFKLRLTDKADIDGLPHSARALAAQQASAGASPEDPPATAADGPWVISLDMPSYLPAMQHIKNRDIREKLYRAYITRASSDEQDNIPIIRRILQIKAETSAMLGYKSFAEKSLSTKMAPNVETVLELINMLQEKAFPAAQREIKELTEFAQSKGFNGQLQLWDIPFWSERLRENMYQYEEEELRSFFPLPTVLNGMFTLANRLFGITIKAADGDAQVWHPDVRFFNILDDKTGEHIASFFLDPYSRPADKRGGAWMDVCIGKSKVMSRKPVAYLTCNGSPPVAGQPSLMTFREVETLFHEFGHGLQHMLTRVEHGEAAGINNVEWDAVELPSQFMENWCYDKPTLYGFAKHYQTGEPLPDELFQKIKASKNFQAGLAMLRQLFFGSMDMQLHSEKFDPFGTQTPFEVQHELAKRFTVVPPLPEDRFLCSFGHIFGGGYSAGYYSYKWAEVMSADAFAAFEEVGLDNEDAVRETGRRFRETVLALGGGRHPSDVFKDFRGRDPRPEALLRHSGLL